jgi:putative acetyltransferase
MGAPQFPQPHQCTTIRGVWQKKADPISGRARPGSHRMDVRIREEHETDHEAVSSLHTLAFRDAGRVARLVDALRIAKPRLPPLSFVATLHGQVTGHVMLSACRLDALRRLVDVYVLAPLGVLPACQRNGIGTQLVRRAVGAADVRGLRGPARFQSPGDHSGRDRCRYRKKPLKNELGAVNGGGMREAWRFVEILASRRSTGTSATRRSSPFSAASSRASRP